MEIGYFSEPFGESAETHYDHDVHLEPSGRECLRQVMQQPLHPTIVEARNDVGHADGQRNYAQSSLFTRARADPCFNAG